MTFFNKKTEVMQIEMTPYGRYLYSIGKFMPHSYEFVDDDILYRSPGSSEPQESANSRILNETPKTKINRAFQEESWQVSSPPIIDNERIMVRKMNMRQADLSPMGKSSYSGNSLPTFQLSMLQGSITGSQMIYEVASSNIHGQQCISGNVFVPQIDVDLNFICSLKDQLDPPEVFPEGSHVRSPVFSDGTYLEVRYQDPIFHLKEFNSFYEKDNFDIEYFLVNTISGDELLTPLNTKRQRSLDHIPSPDLLGSTSDYDSEIDDEDAEQYDLNYYFTVHVDEEIDSEILCGVVSKLEINNHFLDKELICPDQRTDRFNIYSTRVGPDDLEDCD